MLFGWRSPGHYSFRRWWDFKPGSDGSAFGRAADDAHDRVTRYEQMLWPWRFSFSTPRRHHCFMLGTMQCRWVDRSPNRLDEICRSASCRTHPHQGRRTGSDRPARDLLLSPDHAILLDGELVQAGALVNGTSIVRKSNVPDVFTHYHVEVDDHSC